MKNGLGEIFQHAAAGGDLQCRMIAQKIQHLIHADVACVSPLPAAMGYDVTLIPEAGVDSVSLKPLLPEQTTITTRRENPLLTEFIHETGGVLVLRNARMEGKESLNLSNNRLGDTLQPDLFHWDSNLAGHITIIAKPDRESARRAPTVYARTAAVKEAIGRLDLSQYDGTTRECIADIRDSATGLGLNLSPESRAMRRELWHRAPHLTADIMRLIPQTAIFALKWEKGMLACVFHVNNRKAGILHARPACGDRINNLKGYLLSP